MCCGVISKFPNGCYFSNYWFFSYFRSTIMNCSYLRYAESCAAVITLSASPRPEVRLSGMSSKLSLIHISWLLHFGSDIIASMCQLVVSFFSRQVNALEKASLSSIGGYLESYISLLSISSGVGSWLLAKHWPVLIPALWTALISMTSLKNR